MFLQNFIELSAAVRE